MCSNLSTPINTVWFCGADVAKGLGYADTVSAIKAHCKSAKTWAELQARQITGLGLEGTFQPPNQLGGRIFLVCSATVGSRQKSLTWLCFGNLKTEVVNVPPGRVLGRTYRKGIVKPTLIFQPSEAAGK